MQKIEIKRNIYTFYLAILFLPAFYIFMAYFMGLLFLDKKDTGLNIKDYLLPPFILLLIVMAIYTVHQYLKISPRVFVQNSSLQLLNFGKSQLYDLDTISSIEYTGKKDFRYIISNPAEGMKLVFKDGKQIVLFDSVYKNIWELKSLLAQKFEKEGPPIQDVPFTRNDFDLSNEIVYHFKGNPFFSLRGFTLWVPLLSIIGGLLFSTKLGIAGSLFLASFGLLWYLYHSRLMFYFGISQNFLIVRNHLLPWFRKAYPLRNIRLIILETQPKMPNCLRVIDNEFRSKLYPAGTLTEEHWEAITKDFKASNIIVNDEGVL